MEALLVSQADHVLYLTLNRPDKYNSVTKELAKALQAQLEIAATDDSIRCVYITGNGKAFCAGQDLVEATDPNISLQTIVKDHYNPIIEQIRNLPKPVVAAVNGVAAGAGANIALACDLVVATRSASFIQAFSKIGLVPDSGGSFTLPRLIGFQRASALIMLGDKVSAEDALQMGMLYKVYNDGAFEEDSKALAMKLAQMPTKGLAMTKELLNKSMTNDLTAQLAMEEQYQTMASETEDYAEGVQAFLEKRKPNFKGK